MARSQAALLLKLCGVVGEAGHVREDALFQTGHEDRGELQALCRMHGHHGDGVRLARKCVEVAAERKPLEQRRERLAGKGP